MRSLSSARKSSFTSLANSQNAADAADAADTADRVGKPRFACSLDHPHHLTLKSLTKYTHLVFGPCRLGGMVKKGIR